MSYANSQEEHDANLNAQGQEWEVQLKNYVVILDSDNYLDLWEKGMYDSYVRKALSVGACPAVKIVTTFDRTDDYLAASGGEEKRFTLSDMKDYLQHLPTCWTMQDWSEAIDAMGQTPEKFKDEDWQVSYDEMRNKMQTCSCGLDKILKS